MTEKINNIDHPIKIEGNMHPKMAQALENLKKQQQAKTNSNEECKDGVCPLPTQPKSVVNNTQQRPPVMSNKSAMPEKQPKFFKDEWQSYARPQGSETLEHLINELKRGEFEEIELPSRGKFYNGNDGPINGVLHMKSMTGAEEQILATPRFARRGQNLNMIFQRCLKEPCRVESLLSVDRTLLLIYLRAISYSSEYEVEIKCPDTNQKFTHKIDLFTDLMVNYCPDDFTPDNLYDKLPVSGFNFRYRLSRGTDEVAISDYREKMTKRQGADGIDESWIFRVAMLIEDIEGLTNKAEIAALIKQLRVQDVSYLRTVVTEPPFGIDTKITVYSPFTMNEFEIDLPLETGFFFPRQKPKKEEESSQNSQKT